MCSYTVSDIFHLQTIFRLARNIVYGMDQDDIVVLAVFITFHNFIIEFFEKKVVLKLAVLFNFIRNSCVLPFNSWSSGNSMLMRFFPIVPESVCLKISKYLKASSSGKDKKAFSFPFFFFRDRHSIHRYV